MLGRGVLEVENSGGIGTPHAGPKLPRKLLGRLTGWPAKPRGCGAATVAGRKERLLTSAAYCSSWRGHARPGVRDDDGAAGAHGGAHGWLDGGLRFA